MNASEAVKVSNLSPEDYILYQISKSKQYDMELLEESAEARGEARGEEKRDIKYVLRFYQQGKKPSEISDLLGLPLEYISEIIRIYAIE